MTRIVTGALLCSAALFAVGPAFAQQQPLADGPSQSMFTRDRNVSVSQRPRPGYDASPIPLGGFTGLPKLDVGVEGNDNVYASSAAKKSDTVFTINPEFDLASRWSRNALQGFARVASRQYSKFRTENTTDWQVGGGGRLDIGHGNLSAGGDTGQFSEPRTSPTTSFVSTKPIQYKQSNAYVAGMEELNRIRLTARYDYSTFDYQNGAKPGGGVVLEDDRDHYVSTVTGKAEYALSPATALFVDASYNEHHYSLNPPVVSTNRNSKGSQVAVGANFDLSHVARGEVEVGYLKQDFRGNLGSVSGLSAKGQVEWFPTQLTTVTLSGSRSVQDGAATGSPAYIAGVFGLKADHELLRNLILTGQVGTENDDYHGVDRKDTNTNASVAAKYLLNRMVGITVSYNYLNQDSSGAAKGPKYKVNRIMATANLQF
jgi:hypothetical protein